MEVRKADVEARLLGLTCENIVQHDARFGEPHSAGNQDLLTNHVGMFMMGGGPSDTRPKSCGLLLAMVAGFCCFPGITMIVSVDHWGLSNQAVTGIILLSIAVILAIAAAIMCLRSPKNAEFLGRKQQLNDLSLAGSKALLTSRDECCFEGQSSKTSIAQDEVLCECDEILLAQKISSSVTLTRYFAKLDDPSGPFDLDHEAMEKEMEYSLQCACYAMPTSPCKFAKQSLPPENASTDSAIYVDSCTSSVEEMIVV